MGCACFTPCVPGLSLSTGVLADARRRHHGDGEADVSSRPGRGKHRIDMNRSKHKPTWNNIAKLMLSNTGFPMELGVACSVPSSSRMHSALVHTAGYTELLAWLKVATVIPRDLHTAATEPAHTSTKPVPPRSQLRHVNRSRLVF